MTIKMLNSEAELIEYLSKLPEVEPSAAVSGTINSNTLWCKRVSYEHLSTELTRVNAENDKLHARIAELEQRLKDVELKGGP